MNFLEAHKIVATFAGGPSLRFLLAMSGTPDKLRVFLEAAGAKRGRSVEVQVLPFNTLGQMLAMESPGTQREVLVLHPWDLVPEADWRSGLPGSALDLDDLQSRARATVQRIARRSDAGISYVRAPLPPLFPNPATTQRLESWLTELLSAHDVEFLPPSTFSLASYLASGSPFASTELGLVAERIIEQAMEEPPQPKKVLVTDLDNVMWSGVVGEDGLDGIRYLSEGAGFRHFLYQTLLSKLKREGALLAAVSRNDDELASGPFRSGRMTLGLDDFVAVVASYNAKSAQIREIARHLNLGLDSFVFVDDNAIEIEEVSAAIPEIRVVQFPKHDDALPAFFAELSRLFRRGVVTLEDSNRTAMYQRRLETMAPTGVAGADLTEFLRGLEMALTIHDRSQGDRARAVQLINKTNQFNLNGRRVTDEDVGDVLARGGRLYTCTLSDRTGSHGEILSCLIDAEGTVQSLVMSCRVFQRRVEHAFLVWLSNRDDPPRTLAFEETPRNEPMRQFLEDRAFGPIGTGAIAVNVEQFARAHTGVLELFALTQPTPDR